MNKFFLKIFIIFFIFFASANFIFAATTSTLVPIADGGEDSVSWLNPSSTCNTVDCYLEVDETVGGVCSNSDGNTTYVVSSGNGASQTFDINESSIPNDSTITGISVTVCYMANVSAGGFMQTRYCLDGSCTSFGTNLVTGSAYQSATQSFSVNYTKTSSSDIEIGVVDTSAIKDTRVSQIKTIITYTPPVTDTTPPSAVSNLAVSGVTQTSIGLSWTAPGDDAGTGTATSYDIRYSTSNITNDTDFNNATQVTGEPTPSIAGSAESMTVSGLNANTTYYFAIKTSDEVPNVSVLSNITSLSTLVSSDTTPPSAVSNLAVSGVTQTSIGLSWTAPGDDASTGTATSYDIRYSTSNITNDTDFNNATQVTGEPTPSIAGSSESMNVTGLTLGTTYYFAIKTSDEVPNTSSLSNVISGTTSLVSDTTLPSAISDLTASNPSGSSVDLDWTASGDDGGVGTATSYDIRYSTSNIDNSNWSLASQVVDEPTPSVAGSAESMTVTGLNSGTTYYFAMKVSDEVPNTSILSNVANATTQINTTTIPSGGGGNVSPTRVLFSGWAFPNSQVKVLVKSDISPNYKNVPVSSYSMSKEGIFSLNYMAFLTGKYLIGLKAVDKTGHETGILSFGVDFATQPTLIIEDIVIPPTIIFGKDILSPEENFSIQGYSSPVSEVEIKIDDIIKGKMISSDEGYYSFDFNSGDFSEGIHYVRVKQKTNDLTSSYSFPKTFNISKLEYPKADFNNDNKVNVVDWSMFLFRWGSKDTLLRSKIDMDNNGIINIVDFSIFLKAIGL